MGTRRRRERKDDTYRPEKEKRQKAEKPPEAAQVDNTEVVKALKDVKPAGGEYVVKVRKNEITIEGESESRTIKVKGGVSADTLLDTQTAKAFALLKGPIAIEQRGDNLRVTETTGRSPTSFSITVRKPASDFADREVNFSKPQTFGGKKRIEAAVQNKQGRVVASATVEQDRSGDWVVYQGYKKDKTFGQQRDVLYRASSLENAKRYVRNLPSQEAKTS